MSRRGREGQWNKRMNEQRKIEIDKRTQKKRKDENTIEKKDH